MTFRLESVVPWGRSLAEYRSMFSLTEAELASRRIAGFGDGPASFNCEVTALGGRVVSLDPIYAFSRDELRLRIDQTRDTVIAQTKRNMGNYLWNDIKDIAELERRRMGAMRRFLGDYDAGRAAGRYVRLELPAGAPFADKTFDIGLSSHFLLMYTALGFDFHVAAISEMLRVCREVRIFPLLDLDSRRSELAARVAEHFAETRRVAILRTNYEFQKGGDKLMRIS